MAKEIDYKDYPATVLRTEGAPQYYIRVDQIYRQNVDEESDLIEGDEEHIDWGKAKAMQMANGFQLAANKKASKEKRRKK